MLVIVAANGIYIDVRWWLNLNEPGLTPFKSSQDKRSLSEVVGEIHWTSLVLGRKVIARLRSHLIGVNET